MTYISGQREKTIVARDGISMWRPMLSHFSGGNTDKQIHPALLPKAYKLAVWLHAESDDRKKRDPDST
jgi:hypothetical protein